MADDDACSVVKADLEAGTFTRYTTSFPIYIIGKDPFKGGNVYVILDQATRTPVQLVNGPILFTKRACLIEIVAPIAATRDDIWDDIVDILVATSRGYRINSGADRPVHYKQNRVRMRVEMLL